MSVTELKIQEANIKVIVQQVVCMLYVVSFVVCHLRLYVRTSKIIRNRVEVSARISMYIWTHICTFKKQISRGVESRLEVLQVFVVGKNMYVRVLSEGRRWTAVLKLWTAQKTAATEDWCTGMLETRHVYRRCCQSIHVNVRSRKYICTAWDSVCKSSGYVLSSVYYCTITATKRIVSCAK